MHGHTWSVEVEVSAKELGSAGMVIDFQHIKDALRLILSCFDHTVLNDNKSFKITSPTAENVATVIFSRMRDQIKQTSAVTVWESQSAWVRLEETPSQ
jgi:6-pyruvoyltetrahydropterin/6-carboxytetrahydropterin synthase